MWGRSRNAGRHRFGAVDDAYRPVMVDAGVLMAELHSPAPAPIGELPQRFHPAPCGFPGVLPCICTVVIKAPGGVVLESQPQGVHVGDPMRDIPGVNDTVPERPGNNPHER